MRLLPPILMLLLVTPSVPRAADPGVEFFEKKIRPMLSEHCYKCHSSEAESNKKLKGGLVLDSQRAITTGGDSGPAIVPKKPAESLFLKSLKYDGDLKMPPKGKLSDAQIADFEKWISLGAPGLPAGGAKKQVGLSLEEGRKFWAYQLPKTHELPKVKDASWPKNDVDPFILAKLEAKGMTPAKDAEKATLLRRLYFDLIGLPPTPAQVDAFVKDTSPTAYEKVVDQLLASPQFGERWGRHWLDIARYADSINLRGFVYKNAWRYRDYVIESFNRDTPFDQFVRQQIAGDLIKTENSDERMRNTIATTFLALGNNNLEEQDKKQLRMDVVDEQLDVITKGFLGQTVTCARCHDHKFDPIPTKDYYALAGFFRNVKALETANVSNWIEVPLPVPAEQEATLKKHEEEVAALQKQIAQAKKKPNAKANAAGILAVKDIVGIVVDDKQAKKVGMWQDSAFSGNFIGEGYLHDQNGGKGEKTLTFQPEKLPAGRYEVRLAYSPGGGRSTEVPVEVFSADGEKTIKVNMQTPPSIEGRYISLGEFRYEAGGQNHVIISNEGTKGHVTADAIVFVPLDGKAVATSDAKTPEKADTGDSLKKLEAQMKKLQENGPKRPKSMSVLEEAKIEETRVHVRGSVHNLGEAAPRGFLQVATYGSVPAIPKDRSGRLELANWIASKENPLTARVIANRAWHWLLGSGIVRTTDNFGTTGELPSHPELLDHLAVSFVQDGWSMKKLVKKIVMSRTYQQSVSPQKDDPDNRLFGSANRRRLDAECIRDAMLAISGKLDKTQGGQTFPESLAADYNFKTDLKRRSVYLPMFRNAMPELLEVFDAADTSMVTGKRNTSTVAQQALFLMNNPFPQEQAKHTAEQLLSVKTSESARVDNAYRLVLGRESTVKEREVALKFLDGRDDGWPMLVQAIFASADFRYID